MAKNDRESLPHGCGGVSAYGAHCWRLPGYAPLVLGCFSTNATRAMHLDGLPHGCGGVSPRSYFAATSSMFATRVWGCFPARSG